jgi:hypothetical protein
LAKLPEKLDIEKAPRALFEPDSKERLNSLTTVLQQEVDRYNRLLNIIKLSLINQMKAIKGLVVMDDTLEKSESLLLLLITSLVKDGPRSLNDKDGGYRA